MNWEEANPEIMQHVEELHDQMRAIFAIPGMSLGSPKAVRKPKEVKKDVEAGHWTACGYTIVNGYGEPVAIATPNDGVDKKHFERALTAAISSGKAGKNAVARRQDFPPEGKALLSKPHPADCICSEHKPKTGIISTVKRIGDAERDACLDLLRDRHVSGHLTLEEFEARKDKALTARSQHELDYLTQDLPAALPKPAVAPGVRRDHDMITFLCRVISAALPVMAAITILMGAGLVSAAVLAAIGGLAAVLLSFLQLKP